MSYIKSKTGIILDREDCKTAITIINERRLDRTSETNQAHVEHLRQKHGNKVRRTASINPMFLLRIGIGVFVVLAVLSIFSNKRLPESDTLSTSLIPAPGKESSAPVQYSELTTEKHREEPGIIYQWKDVEGRTHYSNIGAPEGSEVKKLYPRGYKFTEGK